MASSRKSSHESALNCCDTILQLYSVFVFRIAPPPYRPVCFYSPMGRPLPATLHTSSNPRSDRAPPLHTHNQLRARQCRTNELNRAVGATVCSDQNFQWSRFELF